LLTLLPFDPTQGRFPDEMIWMENGTALVGGERMPFTYSNFPNLHEAEFVSMPGAAAATEVGQARVMDDGFGGGNLMALEIGITPSFTKIMCWVVPPF
jgi:hypothetical protein